MELSKCEFSAKNTSIKKQIDDLTVLQNVGLWLGERGDEIANFILIILGQDKGFRATCASMHWSYIIIYEVRRS